MTGVRCDAERSAVLALVPALLLLLRPFKQPVWMPAAPAAPMLSERRTPAGPSWIIATQGGATPWAGGHQQVLAHARPDRAESCR